MKPLKAAALIAVFCFAAFAGGRYQELELFSKALSLVQNQYFRPVEERRLIYGAIKGMLQELDPHSHFFTPKEAQQFLQGAQGYSSVLGFSLEQRASGLHILSVLEGSAAEEAGLQIGDKIIALNGKPAASFKKERFWKKLSGKGRKILLIEREGRRLRLRLQKKLAWIPSVRAEALKKGYLYLRIYQFTLNGFAEVRAALTQAASSNNWLLDARDRSAEGLQGEKAPLLKGLLMDLRGNPGGSFEQAVKTADLFLSTGLISIYRQRGKEEQVFMARKAPTLGAFPIVVLINERSISAAETLASALKENQRAIVTGKPSFGKGAVQSFFKLQRGHALQLTSGEYKSPSGKAIQGRGVWPHIPLSLKDGEGAQEGRTEEEQAPLAGGGRKRPKMEGCERAAAAVLKGQNFGEAVDREKEQAFYILKNFHKLAPACLGPKT